MLTFQYVTSDVGIRRSQLKHSWLENQVMTKSPDDVVGLWRGPRWPALEREFSARIGDAWKLADELDFSFSPAVLVDRLAPLSGLSEDTRRALTDVVHAVYCKESGIAASKQSLCEAVLKVSEALERLRKAWDQPVSEAAEHEIRVTWCEMYRSAVRLRNSLDELPLGVMLP